MNRVKNQTEHTLKLEKNKPVCTLLTLFHTDYLLWHERGSRRERFQSAGEKIRTKFKTHTYKEIKVLRI